MCNDFFKDIWAFIGTQPPIFSKKLIEDIYDLGRNSRKIKESDRYIGLCWCCRDLAKKLKSPLPENIHARLILGPTNEYTKSYAVLCEKYEIL